MNQKSSQNSDNAAPILYTVLPGAYNYMLKKFFPESEKDQKFNFLARAVLTKMDDEMLKGISLMTLKWYNNTLIARNALDEFINDVNNWITSSLIPFQQQKFEQRGLINECPDKATYYRFVQSLNETKNPFEEFLTETARFNSYAKFSSFVQPKVIKFGGEIIEWEKVVAQSTDVKLSKGILAYVPLTDSLKILFEMPGMHDEITKYMKYLYAENEVISNCVQAKLWQTKYLEDYDSNIFPLDVYYDDLTTGNALGSHADKTKIGGVYVSMPFLPPRVVAKLDYIFLSTIFYSKDRTSIGNIFVFGPLINELDDLSRKGMTITINGQEKTLKFRLLSILGDNLALNGCCGFTESFKSKNFCRICRAVHYQCERMTVEIPSFLRNKENYAEDLSHAGTSEDSFGIKEECVFHLVDRFHITENRSVDIMHDILEGIAPHLLQVILTRFVYVDKFFDLNLLNARIRNFNYGHFESNTPQPLSKAYRSKEKFTNKKIIVKQSAAEILCLIRYLGIIIGDLIPVGNETWQLYTKLREIIQLTTSHQFFKGEEIVVKLMIEDYNRLYIKLVKLLKPKLHIWTHHWLIMQDSGPLVRKWAMPYERKNRQVKEASLANSCYRNLPLTLAVRNQLKLCYMKENITNLSNDLLVTPGTFGRKIMVKIKSTYRSHRSFNYFEKDGNVFKPRDIIVTGKDGNGEVIFRQIHAIYEEDNEIYLLLNEIQVLYSDFHLCALRIQLSDTPTEKMKASSIPETSRCLLVKKNINYFIVSQYRI